MEHKLPKLKCCSYNFQNLWDKALSIQSYFYVSLGHNKPAKRFHMKHNQTKQKTLQGELIKDYTIFNEMPWLCVHQYCHLQTWALTYYQQTSVAESVKWEGWYLIVSCRKIKPRLWRWRHRWSSLLRVDGEFSR